MMAKSEVRIFKVPICLSESVISNALSELLQHERDNRSAGCGWGYFQGMESDSNSYPKTIRLRHELEKKLIPILTDSKAPFSFSFIKMSEAAITASFGGLHLDSHPGLKEDEEIERILINLHEWPRQLRIAHADRFTLAKLGIHYDRHYYTLLQLPSTIETSVLEIPARDEGGIFIAVFLASQVPHVGVTNTEGHFVASFQRISTQVGYSGYDYRAPSR
jgi:hypothetical protein